MPLALFPLLSRWRVAAWLLLAALWFGGGLTAHATHNRAGEITYSHVQGLTYEVVITTYTKASALADRPWLFLTWGDEVGDQLDSLERELPVIVMPGDIQKNVYRGTHTYGGPGIYPLTVEDPNRNEGVLNMTGSVDTPFAIQSLLIIDPQAGHNNSVQLLNPATENACLNQPWVHNPAAHDPDGDILTYSLVPCRGFGGEFIPTYLFPDEVSNAADVFAIDAATGDLTWETPQLAGEYNVAIRIEEWREVGGLLRKVGEVTRDLQIDVQLCANQAPELVAMSDTCVLAGESLTFTVFASDPDGDGLTLSAVGGALTEVAHTAQFAPAGGGTAAFTWSPECAEVRAQPYQVVFKVQDVGNAVPLVDSETRQITVISPSAEGLSVEPVGYDMTVGWTPNACVDELATPQQAVGGYDVYRRLQEDETDWEPALCETGVPDGVGYDLVGSVEDLDGVGWVDETGLSFGVTYCYRVVTRYGDGALSLASEEVCNRIRKDVPVMTRASVQTTGPSDSVLVGWSPPSELDVLAFPGPYRYELRGEPMDGFEGEDAALWASEVEVDLMALDTVVWLTDLDTEAFAWSFSILLYSDGELVGVPPPATTPWLRLTPDDNQLRLDVMQGVPWQVSEYVVEKQVGGAFVVLDTVGSPTFVDTGLVNGATYCYRVTTVGGYDDPTTESPLLNRSQELCGEPYDYTPPCNLALEVDANCAVERDTLRWSVPESCTSDDIMGYRIYWAPFLGDSLTLWRQVDDPETTTAVFNEDDEFRTIAGCFVVTALDSLMPGPDGELRRNESLAGDTVCVDNCPFYFLPNVFTPNADESNDSFRAFPWKFVDSVNVVIHNRWGEPVFETNDPDVNWDGTYLDTGVRLPEGVYFYTATVFTRRLEGIVPEKFSGQLHMVVGSNPTTD
ncbi:MAG: gliding motility-associated C-terminal domain-containing protein [Flavobacteriales bacterium]|nr:gliding motility-associated C-terminal domain-containing protein [Flavobacteriales bacterium]